MENRHPHRGAFLAGLCRVLGAQAQPGSLEPGRILRQLALDPACSRIQPAGGQLAGLVCVVVG